MHSKDGLETRVIFLRGFKYWEKEVNTKTLNYYYKKKKFSLKEEKLTERSNFISCLMF